MHVVSADRQALPQLLHGLCAHRAASAARTCLLPVVLVAREVNLQHTLARAQGRPPHLACPNVALVGHFALKHPGTSAGNAESAVAPVAKGPLSVIGGGGGGGVVDVGGGSGVPCFKHTSTHS